MDAFKKFFEKKKADAKFKLAGQGHRYVCCLHVPSLWTHQWFIILVTFCLTYLKRIILNTHLLKAVFLCLFFCCSLSSDAAQHPRSSHSGHRMPQPRATPTQGARQAGAAALARIENSSKRTEVDWWVTYRTHSLVVRLWDENMTDERKNTTKNII